MDKITASIKKELYKIEIHSSSGNVLIADEPETVGGKNQGFSPNELLASSLAACTSATLRMYADRKGWDLEEVKMEVHLEVNREGKRTEIYRKIELIGNLDQAQRDRMLAIANSCPVHKILSGSISIQTELKEN
ncbi:MAG: OsmC family protein [Algoriphagus aquaeductus]|uniref:OsmC family protein n=1 Tax=Algoriphagus aquaeductus TaxID=475299 RepID=UPI00391B9852